MAVGDATCHLVRSGDDAMLWDGGASSPGFGLVALPRLVREVGAGRVRTAVVTHANLDHFGALVDAAPRLGIERVIVCGPLLEMARSRPDSAAGMMVALLSAQGVRIETAADGDELPFGDVTLQFLSPLRGGTFKSVNDTSLVGVFAVATEGGVRRVMMTGDIGPEGMRALHERHSPIAADVLEVPHHGSFNYEASALVQALDPAIVLQSTGRLRVNDPRWTHARAGRIWHCTAVDGLITTVIQSDGTVASDVWVDERRDAILDRSTDVHE
jgi:competence protein ComEC